MLQVHAKSRIANPLQDYDSDIVSIVKKREDNLIFAYRCSWFGDRRVFRRTNGGPARRPGPSSAGGSRHSSAVWRRTGFGPRERRCSWPSSHRLWPVRKTDRVRWKGSSWCLRSGGVWAGVQVFNFARSRETNSSPRTIDRRPKIASRRTEKINSRCDRGSLCTTVADDPPGNKPTSCYPVTRIYCASTAVAVVQQTSVDDRCRGASSPSS